MNEKTKPPEGLELAETLCGHAFCADACTEDQMRAAVDAIRTERAQRLTLAQRVADLEKERNEWQRLASAYSPAKELAASLKQAKASGDAARKERDELRAQLEELGQQEPVAWAPSCANAEFAESVRGYGQQFAVWFDRHALEHPGRGHCQTPLYARPVAATPAEHDVLAERRRQVEREGMTQSHDDAYLADELPLAACCYCVADEGDAPPAVWPWATKWWKPKDRRSNMVRAAALLLADIERVDRMAQGHKA